MKKASCFAVALLCASVPHDALAWKQSVFLDCRARDYVRVDEYGKFSKQENSVQNFIETRHFVLDIEARKLRHSDGRLMKLDVIQRGDGDTEAILVPKGADRKSVGRFTLHIRDFEDLKRNPEIVFWITMGEGVVSGACEGRNLGPPATPGRFSSSVILAKAFFASDVLSASWFDRN